MQSKQANKLLPVCVVHTEYTQLLNTVYQCNSGVSNIHVSRQHFLTVKFTFGYFQVYPAAVCFKCDHKNEKNNKLQQGTQEMKPAAAFSKELGM